MARYLVWHAVSFTLSRRYTKAQLTIARRMLPDAVELENESRADAT